MTDHTLAHDFVLLALDDRDGTWLVSDGILLHAALAGALVAELLHRDRLAAVEAHRFAIRDGRSEGLLGEVEDLLRWRKPYKLDVFLNHLASRGGRLLQQVCDELVAEGVLRQERDKLWILTWRRRHTTADPGVEHDLRDHLRSYATEVTADVPPTREDTLLSLLRVSKLFGEVWTEPELTALEPHLVERTERAPIGRDVYEVVQATHAALVAVMATTVT